MMVSESLPLGGDGRGCEKQLTRAELAILQKQIDSYPIGSAERAEAVDWVMETGRTTQSKRTKLAAAKTLAVLDGVSLKEADLRIKAANGPSGTTVNITQNTQVNVAVDPTTNARRTEEAMALLDTARARAISNALAPAVDTVHQASAIPEAIPLPGNGLS